MLSKEIMKEIEEKLGTETRIHTDIFISHILTLFTNAIIEILDREYGRELKSYEKEKGGEKDEGIKTGRVEEEG